MFDPSTTELETEQLFNFLASQPVAQDMDSELVLYNGITTKISTMLMGMLITFEVDGTQQQAIIAEFLLACIEGFQATLLNRKIYPTTAKTLLTLRMCESSDDVKFNVDQEKSVIEIIWPDETGGDKAFNHEKSQKGAVELAANILGMMAIAENVDDLFDELVVGEQAFDRCVLASNCAPSHTRVFGTPLASLADLPFTIGKTYPCKQEIPIIDKIKLSSSPDGSTVDEGVLKKHSEIEVQTIINQYLWDNAKWCGTGYSIFSPTQPPIMGLMFKDETYGAKIFREWREKFGDVDKDEVIRVAAITGVEESRPQNYRVHISRDWRNKRDEEAEGKKYLSISRFNLMTPKTDQNLEMFKKHYEKIGMFYLVPMKDIGGQIQPDMGLSIMIRKFHCTEAWEIHETHEDSPAIKSSDKVVIPEGDVPLAL